MSALATMLKAGFNLSIKGENLLVSPSHKLSTELRQFIKQHKPQIIAELKAANDIALEPRDRAAILRWLTFIGENSQSIIDEVLSHCASNPDALTYYLKRAKEVDLYTQAIKSNEAST